MNILITASTAMELAPFLKHFALQVNDEGVASLSYNNNKLTFLPSGIGYLPAAVKLSQYVSKHQVDYILAMGIAGSFQESILVLDIVEVEKSIMADWGAESPEGFLDAFDLNLLQQEAPYFQNKQLYPCSTEALITHSYKKVTDLSVQSCSGTDITIAYRKTTYQADIETMEGAVYAYISQYFNIPMQQFRCISNPIEPRNKNKWKLSEAIHKLGNFMIDKLAAKNLCPHL